MTSTNLKAVIEYSKDVWSLRYFVMSLVRIDLRNRYKRCFVGIGWSMLQPMAMTAVLCFAFHAIFKIELSNYAPLLLTGMAFWGFFAAAISDGSQAFFGSQGFIKAERIPLAVYPLRVVLGLTIHFGITLVLALVLTGILKGYSSILPLVSLLPTLLLLFAFGWSLSVVLAFGVVHFPDIQQIATIVLQMLFYLTPVIYPPEVMRGLGPLALVLKYNPLTAFINLLRDPIMNCQFPTPASYAIAGGITACTFAAAIVVLAYCERRLIFALV